MNENGQTAFVYRSYEDPDNNEINPVYLTAAFVNRLKFGSLEIVKKLNVPEDELEPMQVRPIGSGLSFLILPE